MDIVRVSHLYTDSMIPFLFQTVRNPCVDAGNLRFGLMGRIGKDFVTSGLIVLNRVRWLRV